MGYINGIDLNEEMGMMADEQHAQKKSAARRAKRLEAESQARRDGYAKTRADKKAAVAAEAKVNSGNRSGMYDNNLEPFRNASKKTLSGVSSVAKSGVDRLKDTFIQSGPTGRDWQNNMPFSPVGSNRQPGFTGPMQSDAKMFSKPRGIFEQVGYENSFNEWASKSKDKELRGRPGAKQVRDRRIKDRAQNWDKIRSKNQAYLQEARSINQLSGDSRAFNLNKSDPNNERSLYRASIMEGRDAAKGREASKGFLNARNEKFAGSFTYMYKSATARNAASVGEHFSRAAIFATAGSGLKRESFMNSLGMLTKNQKAEVKLSSSGALLRSQKWIIPGAAAITSAMTLLDGGDITDYAADYIIPETLMFTGWNVGKNAGYGISKALGAGSKTMLGSGMALGGTLAATGLAVGVAAGYLLTSASDSNNLIRDTAHDILNADFDSEHATTQSSLTHRQRAMNKLSKSALNDRGQLIGNEASILAGVY